MRNNETWIKISNADGGFINVNRERIVGYSVDKLVSTLIMYTAGGTSFCVEGTEAVEQTDRAITGGYQA